MPHATEYVDEMVEMIGQLVEIGRAYTTEDGVYLSVETVEDYGLLAGQRLDQLLEGGGDREVFGAENKRHPADFVLWKVAKPNEPSWPSPWGEGRPGWHSECVVMSLDLLGEGFDLHCGGMDLKFPHHENERAQAVALGKRFANHWMHNGFVVDAEGEKMSKSLGNVTNLLDLTEHYDPRAYRMLLLQSHYRSPVAVGQDNIDASVKALAGLDAFAARAAGVPAADADAAVIAAVPRADGRRPRHPGATALLFDTVRRANAAIDADDPAARRARRRRRGTSALRSDWSSTPAATSQPRRRPRRPRSTRPAPRRTSPPPTGCVASCRPPAGPWRPPSPARRCAAEPLIR